MPGKQTPCCPLKYTSGLILYSFCYLNRSGKIRCFEAKVDLAGNGQADKQPVVKTEVVDQLENIGHGQVEQRHGTLGREDNRHTHTHTYTYTHTQLEFGKKHT